MVSLKRQILTLLEKRLLLAKLTIKGVAHVPHVIAAISRASDTPELPALVVYPSAQSFAPAVGQSSTAQQPLGSQAGLAGAKEARLTFMLEALAQLGDEETNVDAETAAEASQSIAEKLDAWQCDIIRTLEADQALGGLAESCLVVAADDLLLERDPSLSGFVLTVEVVYHVEVGDPSALA